MAELKDSQELNDEALGEVSGGIKFNKSRKRNKTLPGNKGAKVTVKGAKVPVKGKGAKVTVKGKGAKVTDKGAKVAGNGTKIAE